MKKRLAVVITGWHYPYHFYNQMIKQKKPTDWDIDYYVIGHRDPKFANGEKNIKVDADNILDKLDYEIYKEDITIEDIDIDIPDRWQTTIPDYEPLTGKWWSMFNDPELEQFIDAILENSPNIKTIINNFEKLKEI